MTPPPPYRKKLQLSNSLILIITSLLASAGILTYLFMPGKKDKVWVDSSPPAKVEEETVEEAPVEEEEPYRSPDDELTREELEKLPLWEANFARMPKEKRLTFATAFAKAKLAYSQAQWAICLAHLNDCELVYAESPNVWNLRTCALLERGAYDEAEGYIDRSLALNPEDAVALLNQSDLYMLRGDFKGCVPLLKKQLESYTGDEPEQMQMHDIFAFRLLLCHLMLRQEMEARAIVANITPMRDSPLYYFAEAAFCIYKGDSTNALPPLRAATSIYGESGAAATYRQWMDKCGLKEKYIDKRRH